MRVNNADPLDSPGNHGRLSRWFSIRRGSTQQYDVDSSDTVSLTSPIKAPQMPQLCEVITLLRGYFRGRKAAGSFNPLCRVLFEYR